MGRFPWIAAGLGPLAACGIGVTGEHDVAPTDAGVDAPAETSGPAVVDAGAETSIDAGAYATRVKAGLLAFYDFEENAGQTVKDAIAPASDLLFTGDFADTVWVPHGLVVKNDTLLATADEVTKIKTSYDAKHEIAVEAWVVPALYSAEDYGRLVTMASSPVARDFSLGSYQNAHFWASMFDGEDVRPDTPENAMQKKMTHLVLTRSSAGAGVLRLYVDGKETGMLAGAGDPAGFASYRLGLGNLPNGTNRSFGGEVHLVAIYDHALSDAEIATNFAAGPDP